MSRIKTLSGAILLMTALAQHSAAQSDAARQIAHCTGRLSAELKNAWLLHPETSDAVLSMRTEFERLLEAVTTRDDAAEALNQRIAAKFAHAALLQRANFSPDAAVRRAAQNMARAYTGRCEGLLLRG